MKELEPCNWIDIVWKGGDVEAYLKKIEWKDDRVRRNVAASIVRLVPHCDVAILHFRNDDITVVDIQDFKHNRALKRALYQVYDNMSDFGNEFKGMKCEAKVLKSIDNLCSQIKKLLEV